MGTAREQDDLDSNFVSVGAKIRDVANTNRDFDWYLIWFVLDNEEIITIVFNQNSNEYNQLIQLGFDMQNIKQNGFQIDLRSNQGLCNYLIKYTNDKSLSYLKSLEIIAQTDELPLKIIKPRFFDIERARLNYAITGRRGEELIAQYLDKIKTQNKIESFNWVNASRESGMPYDFEIKHNDNNVIYTDVKTTSYTFEQGMVFSKGELGFISQNENYHIYRVYDIKEENPSLRICADINQLSLNLVKNIKTFEKDILTSQIKLNSLKLSILPSNKLLNFKDRIIL